MQTTTVLPDRLSLCPVLPQFFCRFFSLSLALLVYSCHDASASAVVAEFAEIDALPSAEVESVVSDGDGEAHPKKRAFGMGGHIVGAFQNMVIISLILFYEVVHNPIHVAAHVGIGILVDGQGTRSVLDEEIEQSCLGQWWQLGKYFAGHEVTSAVLG